MRWPFTRLVIDIGDVHYELHVVTKVIGHDSSQDILGDIVPAVAEHCTSPAMEESSASPRMAHVRCVIHRGSAIVPLHDTTIPGDEFRLIRT